MTQILQRVLPRQILSVSRTMNKATINHQEARETVQRPNPTPQPSRQPLFRNELAEHLDVNEVSKTDAREFALLAAFENPERVAELMRDEGFGTF